MVETAQGGGLLRRRVEGGQRVTSVELFFDLVYVFAVTQLADLLLTHLTVLGAAQTLLLLLAVWWAWVYTAWMTNWFDPERAPVRLVLGAVMLSSLIMSAALPEAFGARGLVFAVAYVVMQIGRSLWIVWALKEEPGLRRNFQRILAWSSASGVLWLAGGLSHGQWREALWLAAVVVDYAGPAFGFFTPGLGRSRTTDWTIAGEHLAERCQQFLIIAFGELILDSGVAFGDLAWTGLRVATLVVAFVGSGALWWIYFSRSAEGGSRIISATSDPGRLGRSAYTYFHLPMVAGTIVAAVGSQVTFAHPSSEPRAAATATILGGAALFLAGHVLFKQAISGRLYVSHLLAFAMLAALVPVGMVVSPLALAGLVTLTLVAVGVWDTWTHWTAGPEMADRYGLLWPWKRPS